MPEPSSFRIFPNTNSVRNWYSGHAHVLKAIIYNSSDRLTSRQKLSTQGVRQILLQRIAGLEQSSDIVSEVAYTRVAARLAGHGYDT